MELRILVHVLRTHRVGVVITKDLCSKDVWFKSLKVLYDVTDTFLAVYRNFRMHVWR